MVFNSDIFLFVFLPIVFTLFWLAKSKQQRYVLLTVSGFIFYGYWNWKFCFLLFLSAIISYTVALLIDRTDNVRARRAWMIASIAVDLGILGFFKYYNFFADTVQGLTHAQWVPVLNVVLPIGISFYTFHTISYIIDVAARRVRPARNVFEYFTYVSLFSQLVAGPIVRFRQIEDDLEHIDEAPREDLMAKGIGFFAVGLVKKVIIADAIARGIDPLLASYTQLSFAGAWAAALGYTFQLYYDFSGYSDMAVGLGYMFGIRIPQNFNAPYRALGIGDFWRRWHISLSSWLRDYLYIPLGGNRLGLLRMNANLLVTMLLGGLWHGASWTFVAWGAYHGLLLAADRAAQPVLRRVPPLAYRAGTFVCVVIGWVLFRATDFTMAGVWLGKMAGIGTVNLTQPLPATLLAMLAVGLVASNALPESWEIKFGARRRHALLYAAIFFLAYLFMNGRESVFLYYQF